MSNHQMKITRKDGTSDESILDTKTYLLHDICHFYVEKELATMDGFWGMLSQGYQLGQLSGKTNKLTEKLRIIESIVGGAQSVYSKHMDEMSFWNNIRGVDYDITDKQFLGKVVTQIAEFMHYWNYLPIGQTTKLEFQDGNL